MHTFLVHKKRFITYLLLAAGLVITLLFGLRACHIFRQLGPPGPPPSQDVEQIRGWMTIPHIGRMYRVPPGFLFEQLNIPNEENGRKSLDELNEMYAPDEPEALLNQVKELVRAYQAEHMPPSPPDGG